MTHPLNPPPQPTTGRRRSPWILVAIALGVIALWFALMLFANRGTQKAGGEVDLPTPAGAPAAARATNPAGSNAAPATPGAATRP